MKIMRMAVHNVAGVRDIDLDLSGRNLWIVGGRNGQGKSSAVRSLVMVLSGRSGMRDYPEGYPEVPLRDGEEEGYIELDLSGDAELHDERGFKARLQLTRRRDGSAKEELILVDSDGDPAPEPRTLLKSLYGARCLDPTAFNRLSRKEQKAQLQSLFPKLDFTELDEDRKKLYDERTGVNREGKTLKARFDSMERYGDAPAEEVSVQDLMVELRRREEVNRRHRVEQDVVTDMSESLERARERLASQENEVSALEAKLKNARRVVKESKKSLEIAGKELDEKKAEVEAMQDEDTSEVERQIAESEETNRKVRANKEREQVSAQLKASREEWQRLTDEMAGIDEEKSRRLREVELPVEGLGIDAEGITYNGLPYEQAPNSTRFVVGAKIAMALKPKLRLLVCEHGDGLDWETLDAFGEFLGKHDYQAIVEVCSKSESDDERCQVVMEDGTDVKGKKK